MKDIYIKTYLESSYNPFIDAVSDNYILSTKKVVETHKREKYLSHKKAIICGNVIEIINYSTAVSYGIENSFARSSKKGICADKREDNISRAKNNLRRLINTNSSSKDSFLTLTYADNVSDVKKCKVDLKRFIQALKRYLGVSMKYCYVVEFQKRGALHFHIILFDVPKISLSVLKASWPHGTIHINRINKVDNVGAYVVKYMSKELVDDRLKGHDLYGRSRLNLLEPTVLTHEKEVSALECLYLTKKVYQKTYESEFLGLVTYTQYNLKR